MPCLSCRERALGRLAAENGASMLVSCLRASFGIGPGSWDEDAHTAFYTRLSSLVDVQNDWGMTPEQIRAVPFGSNPSRTVFYASRYPTRYLVASDSFWSCLGVTQAEARTSIAEESGGYWSSVLVAANRIGKAEGMVGGSGGSKDDIGTPLLVGGLAFVGLLVLGAAGK